MKTESGQSVLIYRLGSLGDTVVALPAFHLVRKAFPSARITLLTNRPVASKAAPLEAILGGSGLFDDVLDYPIGTRSPLMLAKLAWQIRRRGIQKLIYLVDVRGVKTLFRDRLFFRLAGVQEIIGMPAGERDCRVEIDLATGIYERETKRLMRRVRELGEPDLDDSAYWDLRLTPAEEDEARNLTLDIRGAPFLAVSQGTKAQSNDWEETNWTQLMERLAEKYPGMGLLLLGAAEELERSQRCSERWKGPVVNLCGKASPRVGAAALRGASAFVGHDSGPMHLAACMGVPCIGIFSARNPPGRWFPHGSRNHIFYRQTECFGCGLLVCEIEKKRCILSITVDEVENAVCGTLENGSGSEGAR